MDSAIARIVCAGVLGALLILTPLPSGAQPRAHPEAPATTLEPVNANDPMIISVRATKLAGYVHMAIQKNTAVARVLVQELGPDWNRVLGSTYTDYYGHFSLKPAHHRKVHFLRLTAKGFAPANYAVTLSSDAPGELMLDLKLSSDPVEAPYHQSPSLTDAAATVPSLPKPHANFAS